jgi:hypothetical protein
MVKVMVAVPARIIAQVEAVDECRVVAVAVAVEAVVKVEVEVTYDQLRQVQIKLQREAIPKALTMRCSTCWITKKPVAITIAPMLRHTLLTL